MAIPYPTTKAAKSRIYGDPAKNFIDSPAPIFGLLFLPAEEKRREEEEEKEKAVLGVSRKVESLCRFNNERDVR